MATNDHSDFTYMPPMTIGLCNTCGELTSEQKRGHRCARCHRFVCADCVIRNQLNMDSLCVRCLQEICTRKQAKILIAISCGVELSAIPKICLMPPEEARECLNVLTQRGWLMEKRVGFGWTIRLTDEGLAIAETAKAAYSRMNDVGKFLKNLEASEE